MRATLAEVDAAGHRAVLDDGSVLAYDALLIAIGARMEPAFAHAITFGADGAAEALSGLLADLEDGYVRRVAFVLPTSTAWSLPLYELALMTARDIWSAGVDAGELTLVTPEASAMVAALLAEHRIEYIGSVTPEVHHDSVLAGDRRLEVDRTVAMPVPAGPGIPGLPAAPGGFIGVDEHARVRGVEDVYAAGDATDAPIKQGGLAAQQAVVAAEAIAAACGADLEPEPFQPVLRGLLLTRGRERWLRAPTGGTPAATRYLAPVLAGREG